MRLAVERRHFRVCSGLAEWTSLHRHAAQVRKLISHDAITAKTDGYASMGLPDVNSLEQSLRTPAD